MSKVSIIIPVYNKGDYLANCLDSITAQSLDDIDVVCVDDGSSDNSLDILEEYARRDARFTVLSQPNQGASAARNNGINHASGEYIAFMDADDFYPDCDVLFDLYEAAASNDALVCGGSLYELNGAEIESCPSSEAKQRYIFQEKGYVEYRDCQFDYGFTRFIYKRSFLNDRGIRFSNLCVYEDPLFFVTTMTAAKRFYALPRPSYIYRVECKSRAWTNDSVRDLASALCQEEHLAVADGLAHLVQMHLERLHYSYLPAFFAIKEKLDTDSSEALLALREAIPQSIDSELAKPVLDGLAALAEVIRVYRQIPTLSDQNPRERPRSGQNTDPSVSIIIPFYNSEEYLEESIASAASQTYESLDIILVDDGSPDNSIDIAQHAADLDNRIRIVRKENGGLSSARNAGLSVAEGKYVIFLDSDDFLEKDAVRKLAEPAEAASADQVFFSTRSFFDTYEAVCEHPNFISYYNYKGTYPDTATGRELFAKLRENGDFKPSACLQLLRREFLAENNIAFMDGITHEDNLFTMQCLAASKRSLVFDEKLHRRRVRCESIMTSKKGLKNAFGYYRCAGALSIDLLGDNASDDPDFTRAVETQVRIWLDDATRFTADIAPQEISSFMDSLSTGDRLMFRALVINRAKIEKELSKEKKKYQQDISKVKKSHSYRTGHALLFPVRCLKKLRGTS